MKRTFLSFFHCTVRAVVWMWRPETRAALREHRACCERGPGGADAPAHLFVPDGQLLSALAPAKLHRDQLVAIFSYNTWAALTSRRPRTLEDSRWVRERSRGSLVPVDKAWLMSKGKEICFVSRLWHRLLLSLCGNWRFVPEQWSYLL